MKCYHCGAEFASLESIPNYSDRFQRQGKWHECGAPLDAAALEVHMATVAVPPDDAPAIKATIAANIAGMTASPDDATS